MRTLVLNASYEPLCVVHLHRAVVLVLAEKAEPVEVTGSLRSATTEIPAPSVIRLKHMVKIPYRKDVRFSRRGIMARDRFMCSYCDRRADTIDHVIPRSRGGENSWANVVAACRRCNSRKADRTPAEAGMTLLRPPREPQGTKAIVLALGTADPSWMPYLQYVGM